MKSSDGKAKQVIDGARSFFWLFLSLVIFFTNACHNTTGNPQKVPVQILSGPWEYRWGDSPKDAQGRPIWAQPETQDQAATMPAEKESATQKRASAGGSASWQQSGSNTKPGGRGDHAFLFLRTQLPSPAVSQPTLYFLIVEQIFEAYLDGQLIYRFGQLDGEGPEVRRFLGNRTHMIPLPADYAGKQLVLRIYSTDPMIIGISGRVRLGPNPAIIAAMLRDDASSAAVGIILCATGLLAIGLYLPRRLEPAYFYYGAFAFSMGLWLLCQMGCRNYLADSPMGWLTVEIFALYTAVAFLNRYIYQVFGAGPWGLSRVLSYLYGGFVGVSAFLCGFGILPLIAPLGPFRILLLITIVYTLIMMAMLSYRGHAEARLFSAGFLFAALFGVRDTLAIYGLLPRSDISLGQFGQGGFVLFLGLILVRRFQKIHRALAVAEQKLSDKILQLEERNREVQQLNDDLRRQIEARSKDLAASILDASSSFSELPLEILANGFVIANRYRVMRLIGQGGMGTVYEVERLTDGRHLAAKVLSVQAGKQVLARFAREAQLLAKLRHPNLVAIHDVDMTQSKMAYIVMDLVAGQSLAAHAARYGQIEFAKQVLGQIADALAMVHSQGIVHRDLKPDNVLIIHAEDLSQLTVRLVDFGVSMILADENLGLLADAPNPEDEGPPQRPVLPTLLESAHAATLSGAETGSGTAQAFQDGGLRIPRSELSQTARDRMSDRAVGLTQTGVIMGTPLYMAPELRHGAKFARPTSDVFSFGVMAYELLTGQLPSETPALFLVIKKDRPWFPHILSKNPAVPPEMADLIECCLDPRPENRPTAAEIHAALSRLAAAR